MTSYTECSFCKCRKWCRLYDGHIKGKNIIITLAMTAFFKML